MPKGAKKGKSKMKKLKCKKEFGTWYYEKISPDGLNELDAPIYELYSIDGDQIGCFGCYGDMKYFVESGVII